MRYLAGFLLVVPVIAIIWAANTARESAVQPRAYLTGLPPAAIEQIFATAVATTGWRIDPTDPRTATSPLVSGTRQTIALQVMPTSSGCSHVWIGPTKISLMAGLPNKAWTLRHRMERFERALAAADPRLAPSDLQPF